MKNIHRNETKRNETKRVYIRCRIPVNITVENRAISTALFIPSSPLFTLIALTAKYKSMGKREDG